MNTVRNERANLFTFDMIYRYLYFLLLLTATCRPGMSQAILRTNLLAPIVGGASLAVEVAAPAKKSVVFDVSFGKTSLLLPYDQYTFQSVQSQFRFYRQSTGTMCGSYLGPYAKYMHREMYREAVRGSWLFPGKTYRYADGHSVGVGLGIGRQGVLAKRLVMDLSIGLGYLFYVSRQAEGDVGDQIGHLDANVGISLGYFTGRVVPTKNR
jgi:hypothetical protein